LCATGNSCFAQQARLLAVSFDSTECSHAQRKRPVPCKSDKAAPFPAGTKVNLRISHAGVNFTAQGTVAYSRNNGGMGIAFTSIEPSSLLILDA
jgi:hypothetical protein